MFAHGNRSVLVIFYCIILKCEYQIVAFRVPELLDLLPFADFFPQNAVTHPPEEGPLTLALCHLKTVHPTNLNPLTSHAKQLFNQK